MFRTEIKKKMVYTPVNPQVGFKGCRLYGHVNMMNVPDMLGLTQEPLCMPRGCTPDTATAPGFK